MKISNYFTLEELTRSDTATRRGIDNTPGPEAIANLKALCFHVLDPLVIAGVDIKVTSGFRCLELNQIIGSADNSQHVKGQAVDIKSSDISVPTLFKFIQKCHLEFDQLINEFGQWVHISWTPHHRGNILIATKRDGKTIYEEAK